jgi:hypothetical protein
MGHFPSEVMLSDEAFLRLLTKIRIRRTGTVEEARATYEAAADPESPFPKLDDLIEAGWVRVFRGRVILSVDAVRASKIGLAENADAYVSIQKTQYAVKYSFEQADDLELDESKTSLETGVLNLHAIRSERPGWVVARLWEELQSRFSDALEALEYWLDIRQEIGKPSVVPSEVWNKQTVEAFHPLALKYLQSADTVGWNGIIDQLARQMATISNVETDVARTYFLPIPVTISGRYLWLTSSRHERGFHEAIWTLEPLSVVISDLVADIERAELSPAPHPLFDSLMTIIEERPELMFIFNLYLHSRPFLLADLLLRPATSAWACIIIWQWQLRRDAWENNALRQDDDRNKAAAFADAVSVLRYLMDEKGAPAAEAAELLAAVFRYERATGDTSIENSNAMRELLLEEFTRAKTENILKILKALFGSAIKEGPGTGAFDAALALVEAGHLIAAVDPEPLVISYIESMTRDDLSLSAHQIDTSRAGLLYGLATRGSNELQNRFLDPLNVSKRLSARSAPDANPYTIADAVARTLRVHTRVLCRAIVAQLDQVSEDLVNALVLTIETGALDRSERSQVDSFSAHHETNAPWKQRDRPISADLGDALTRLSGSQRVKLLDAILEIEEPMVLARLLFFSPVEIRPRLHQRVMHLTPGKASGLYMLTASQTRIDQLLDAEFPDVAAAFIDAELKTENSWRVPGRVVHRLTQQLRLHSLRQEWEEIRQFNIPGDVPKHEEGAARDTIEFFRGLASLKDPQANREDAEEIFERLQKKHPHLPNYAVNLHAAKVAKLTGQNLFGLLNEDRFPDAVRVIAEGQDELSSFKELTPGDEAVIRLNNVLLLLAMKQPAKSLDALDELPQERTSDGAFAYKAVALARLGQLSEARGVLQVGEQQLGKTPLLEATRKHIASSKPYAGTVNALSDPHAVASIVSAFAALAGLDAEDQARALGAGNGTLGDYLLVQVREAAAALVELRSTMRDLGMTSKEDDLSAMLKEILGARLRHINWTVRAQEPGGHTGAENPGERDLSIKKDTGLLSLIEAVVTRLPTTNQFTLGELKSHLEKLIAYGTCSVYFHVTYEMSGDESGVIEHLRKMSEEFSLDGLTFVEHQEITFHTGPRGFSALYQTRAGPRKMHFLVLDLHQGLSKQAGTKSDASNPRNARASAEKKPRKSTKKTIV